MDLKTLYNTWEEAVTKAQGFSRDKDPDGFRNAWKAAEDARLAFEDAERAENQVKAVTAAGPRIADLRNPDDADQVPVRNADQANAEHAKTGQDFFNLGDGRFVPFANEKSEGYIRNNPVSVQLPEIVARYRPGSDLWAENQLQREAFTIFARRGEKAVARADAAGGHNGKLIRALNALQEGTDSEGGYLVPADERSELIHDPGAPGGVTRPISRVLSTARDAGTFPTGTTVTWGAIAEEATPSDSDPVFDQVSFTIRKSGVNMLLSEELLADSAVNLPAFINRIVRETSGRYEDQQAVEGDGSTEPLGLRTTGAAQGNISDITDLLTLAAPTLTEIVSAYFELPAQFRGAGAAWHTTSSFMARVASISATGGQVFMLPDGTGRPGFRLMGLPVVMFDGTGWDNAAAIAANEEVGAIGDFGNYYWFVDRVGITIARDDSVNFKSDQVAFKARKRFDAFFAENNAFRILKAAAA